MVKIFWNYTIFWHRSMGHKLKQKLISSKGNFVQELIQEFPNDFRLTNVENFRKIFEISLPSSLSSRNKILGIDIKN